MSQRDPFPMQSAQAKAMEESVRSDDASTSTAGAAGMTTWSAMATNTAYAGSSSSNPIEIVDSDEESDTANLVKGSGSGATTANDDNYAESTKLHPDRDDLFLDRPVWESRTKGWSRISVILQRTLESSVHRLYGDQLPMSEFVRTLCLATTLLFMIGGYWLMRSLKDSVLIVLCEDMNAKVRGGRRPIQHQVGIRCRHCAHVPVAQRGTGSVFFPCKTLELHAAAQYIYKVHIEGGQCPKMSRGMKQHFVTLLLTRNTRSIVGKVYWSVCAEDMGLVDTEHGIFHGDDVLVV